MSGTKQDQSSSGFNEIVPAKIDFGSVDAQTPATEPSKPVMAKWHIALLLLLLLAVVVVFFLPSWLSNVAQQQSVDGASSGQNSQQQVSMGQQSVGAAEVDHSSPWADAQKARARKTAQDILQALLDKQFELEERGAKQWASERFHQLLDDAKAADSVYRAGEYKAASDAYQIVLDDMLALEGEMPAIAQGLFQGGLQSLEQGQAESAQTALDMVLLLEPGHSGATQALARVAVLDAVLVAIERGQQLEQQGEYAQALVAYQQASTLDPLNKAAVALRGKLSTKVADQAFAEKMSIGFQHLSQGKQASAIKAFKQAVTIKPLSTDAKEALLQARTKQTLGRINQGMAGAARYERQEKWLQAISAYEAVLKVDAKLLKAQQKKVYAEKRLKLDKAMARVIADPLSLAKQSTFANAKKIHAVAEKIDQPGPRLAQQRSKLAMHITNSQKTHDVFIRSDNLTDIMVQRVSRLGRVTTHTLSLRPGRYIAVGSRSGYRDVRKMFTVALKGGQLELDIRCLEKIR